MKKLKNKKKATKLDERTVDRINYHNRQVYNELKEQGEVSTYFKLADDIENKIYDNGGLNYSLIGDLDIVEYNCTPMDFAKKYEENPHYNDYQTLNQEDVFINNNPYFKLTPKLDDVVKDIYDEFDSYCINNYDRSAGYLIVEADIKDIIEELPNQDMDADWAVKENLNFYDDCLYHTFSKGYEKINGNVEDDYGYVEERMTDSGNYTIDQRIAKGHAMALEQDLAEVVRDVLQEYEITELEDLEKVLKESEQIEVDFDYEEEDDYDM